MDGATHLVIGAAAGEIFGRSPVTKFAAGLLSHLVADAVPHYDPDPRKLEAIPYYLWAAHALSVLKQMDKTGYTGMLAGALGGWAPDAEHVLHYFGFQREKLFPTHLGPQFEPLLQPKLPKEMGVPLTVAINLVCLAFLEKRHKKRKKPRKPLFFKF
ncbi:MAG: hypothetical protein AB1742_02670 [bacterium]